MTPPIGSRVSRVICFARNAALFNQIECPSLRLNATGLFGAIASSGFLVGNMGFSQSR